MHANSLEMDNAYYSFLKYSIDVIFNLYGKSKARRPVNDTDKTLIKVITSTLTDTDPFWISIRCKAGWELLS